MSSLNGIQANQKLTLKYSEAKTPVPQRILNKKIFEEITDTVPFEFFHKENIYNDYNDQVLLPHKMSNEGPIITVGDVNNDHLEDFYIGNASKSQGRLFLQNKDRSFRIQKGPWEKDSIYEDTGTLFFDADNDGDLDLYVVSGGNEFPNDAKEYQDRLYINDGKGNFTKDEKALPLITSSGSCVKAIDFDNDGDLDLFVGGRYVPKQYPFPAKSYILENQSANGTVKFYDATERVAPDLIKAGMVTSALCLDIDNDKWMDLVVTGEWMPICIYKNVNGKFKKTIIEGTRGWWFSINGADFDRDGDIDIVAGNLGLNSRYKAGNDETFDIYAGDFNNSGGSDIVISYYQGNKQFPLRSRACFVDQNPWIAGKFPTNKSFAEATVSDIYSNKVLEKSLHLQVDIFASCYFKNEGNGKFEIQKLPNEAQLSSINDIIIDDFDGDGNLDILAAGNLFNMEIVTPRNDGGAGVLLKSDGNGNFIVIPSRLSGFFAPKDVKDLSLIHLDDTYKAILVGNNNDRLQIFNYK
jgi:hypothetical protein